MTLLEEIACFERQFHCCLAFHDRTGELTALAGGKLALHHANRICEKVRSRGCVILSALCGGRHAGGSGRVSGQTVSCRVL